MNAQCLHSLLAFITRKSSAFKVVGGGGAARRVSFDVVGIEKANGADGSCAFAPSAEVDGSCAVSPPAEADDGELIPGECSAKLTNPLVSP